MRYIELNPVRARMVKQPKDYPWSSYHHNANGKADPLITPHGLYFLLSKDETRR
jgi:putative transposase